MRTTIRMDDELYRQVKARAASEGRPVAEVIADAVRAALTQDAGDSGEPEPLPTFEGTGVLPGVDLTSNAGLREVMDADQPADALR